jgi:hypothetical protein
MNKRIPYSVLLSFTIGVVITALIMSLGGVAARPDNPQQPQQNLLSVGSAEDLVTISLQDLEILQTLWQQNTLDDWNIFARYRALQGIRLAIFYGKSAIYADYSDPDYFDYIVDLAYEIANDPAFGTNEMTRQNLAFALDLLEKGLLMWSDGVESFDGYTPLDYLNGAEAYILQELYLTPVNFYLVRPEYVQFIVDYNDHPHLYPGLRNAVLQQFTNLLQQARIEFSREHDYEDQLMVMLNNLAFSIMITTETYNWVNGFIPPEAFEEEWWYIWDLFDLADSVVGRYAGLNTWMTKTEYAQAALTYMQALGMIQEEIYINWSIYPSNETVRFPDGVFYVDDFGVVREGEIDPFYVRNADGTFRLVTEADTGDDVQLYRRLDDGRYQPIEADGLVPADINPGR